MDLQYLLFLQGLRERLPHWFESFMAAISAIDVHPLLFLIPFTIYWSVDKKKGQIAVIASWTGNILNSLAKLSVCCYRPWIRSQAIHPSPLAIKGAGGYSFPSGHSTSAVAIVGTLGWIYRKKSRALFAFCLAFIVLLAFSRNYLGVHTPQDVVVGLAVGALATWLSIKFVEWSEKNSDKDAQALLLALGIVTLIFIYYIFKNYPRDYKADGSLLVDPKRMMRGALKDCGYMTALAISWFVERKFIKFSTDISLGERICRALAGSALMALFSFVLIPALPNEINYYILNYVKGLLTVFPGALLAPLSFKGISALFARKRNER